MKKSTFIILFLFSFVFNVIAVVYLLSIQTDSEPAQARSFHLNESQKQKINKESSEILEENVKLEGELEKCRQDLYILLNSEDNDRTKIEECISTISNIQKKDPDEYRGTIIDLQKTYG